MNKVGTAYVLWLGGLLGLAGLHRLYNGEIRTGILWLLTFGLFGVGQLADLVLIPQMVETHNARLSAKLNGSRSINEVAQVESSIAPLTRNEAVIHLLHAAEARGGKLSVTQGVMATGLSFTEVEMLLKEMLKTGYVDIGNDPETGIVMYEFHELGQL
jgi:hypothetical protein